MADVRTEPRPVTPLGILAAELARLAAVVDGLDVEEQVQADLRAAAVLAAGLDPYVEACTSPESPALAALTARTRAQDWGAHHSDALATQLEQEMLSGHVEGQLLAFLVHVTGARRVLEVGMFTGYSALAMAEALPDDGVVVACEIDPVAAEVARECFAASPAGSKIDVRLGPAAQTLAAAAGETYDLVFVDADKAGYVEYLRLALGLLAPGGVIAVDNTLMQGQPYLPGEPTANGAAIRAFNDAVNADPSLHHVLLPLRDGLTLIRRV